jgi:glyoxylase-like metal-dependent hydrolase (beta-lactamase superfamily II)
MEIKKIVNAVAQENTYLLSNSAFCMVIDPGSNPEALIDELLLTDRPVSAILLTHAHFDHIMGLELLKNTFPKATIFLHEAEKDWMKNPDLNASSLLMGTAVTAPDADEFYQLEKPYDFDGFQFRVLATPGHSIGGVSLVFDFEGDAVVFTGDALFKNAIGRWDLPTGNHAQLLESIETELFSLPEHYQIFPGHGPSSTIGEEKQNNTFF